MATYTWIGGSGVFSLGSSWTVNGATPASGPGASDDVLIAAAGVYTVSVGSGSVHSLTVTDPTVSVVVGSSLALTGSLSNAGTIRFAAGASFTEIDGSRPSFSNTGSFVVSGGSFTLYGSATTAGLGQLTVNGSADVNLNLVNAGATFNPAIFGTAEIVTGTLVGGSLIDSSGALFAKLDGVTIDGPGSLVSVSAITIVDGISLVGTNGTGSGALTVGAVAIVGPTTLDQATLTFATTGSISTDSTLTFGPALTISVTDQTYSAQLSGAGAMTNNGTVMVHASLTISAAAFTNNSLIATGTASSASRFTVPGPGHTVFNTGDGYVTNAGTILSGGGSVVFRGSVFGSGLIAVSSNGAIAGSVEMTGFYDQQVFAFLDATSILKFDAPSGTNAVLGFQPGNTIELVGTPASVVFSNTTLSIGSGGSTIAGFVLPGIPAGATFSTTIDSSNDTFITETACFLEGTRIRTTHGEVAVEDLRVGDPVLALRSGGALPVVWMGYRTVQCDRHPRPRDVWPVRVAAGAIAEGIPARELWLSPEHAVLVQGVLVPVRLLINGTTIAQRARRVVTYWHVELPVHELVLAEGMPSESYLDTGNRSDFANGGPVVKAHPGFAGAVWSERACLPQLRQGPRLAVIQAALVRRAVRLGYFYRAEMGAGAG